jgi:hypothetical protein
MNKIQNLESNIMFGIFAMIALLKSQLLLQSLGENYSDASKSGCACLGSLGSTTNRINSEISYPKLQNHHRGGG